MDAASHQQYTYADSEDSLPSTYICAVCHDVCGTHSACPGCNQTFCEVCVHKWFDVQRTTGSQCTCPYCRRSLRFSDLLHDPAIQQQLEQLQVLCSNSPAGCPAVMPRAGLHAHLQNSCLFETVACRFCGTTGMRSDIQQHQDDSCSKRLVPCINAAAGCADKVPLDAMRQHVDLNCAYACKPCPHCSDKVPRCAWFSHLQHSCPAQQPCPLRIYGCSFTGDSAVVAAHSSSCEYQQVRNHQLTAVQASQASHAAAAAAVRDPGELPAACVPDAAAAFNAATTHSCECVVRQCLLDSLPTQGIPPKLQQQQQQEQQPPQQLQQQLQAKGVLLQRLAAGIAGPQQLSTPTPPQIFPAPPSPAAAATTNQYGSSSSHGGAKVEPACRVGVVGMSPVERLAVGASGCLSGVGLQPDPVLESAWRILLNLAVVQIFKVQETAADQQLSTFILYSSICRAWDTMQSFCALLSEATTAEEAQEQAQQQEQQQGQPPRSGAASSAAGASASSSANPPNAGMLASVGAFFSSISNRSSGQPPNTSQQPRQQQQQQQQQPRTGRQIWQQWLTGATDQQQQQQPGDRAGRSSHSSGSSSSSSWEGDAYTDANDGMPGLQRGLYEDEYNAVDAWLLKGQQGPMLLSAVASAVYPLALWLSVGGPCFWPSEGDLISQLSQLSSQQIGRLLVKLTARQAKQELREQRKRQREQAGLDRGENAAAAAAAEGHGLGADQAGSGAVGPSSSSSGADTGLASLLQHLPRLGFPPGSNVHELMSRVVATPLPAHPQALLQSSGHNSGPDAPSSSRQAAAAAAAAGTSSLTISTPGPSFSTALTQLLSAAAGAPVSESSNVPQWLWGLRPLVAAELSSALLLLHDVRVDHCEVSLIPGANSHVQFGYRGYWALSVLAGAQAWLGPGFKLSWQALAVVNDMVVLLVQMLCQVLGDSFFDPAEERVPMSPALALRAAQLVLPAGLLDAGMLHLLSLSTSYRDVSCEDLSEVTWEQLTRKLGLVVELDKMVSLVNDLLPVTFEDDEEDEDDDEETDYEDTETDSDSEEDSEEDSSGSGDEEDDGSSYTTEEGENDSYVTDEDTTEASSDSMRDHAAGMQMRRTTATGAAASGAAGSGSRQAGPSVAGRGARARSAAAAAGSPANAAGSSPTSSMQRSSSGEWESADELEAAALEQQGLTGSRPADAATASTNPVSAAAAAGSGAGVQPLAASSVIPPAAAGPPSTTDPTQASMQGGSGQLHQQVGQVSAAAQETTAGSIGSGGVAPVVDDCCPGSAAATAAAAGDWRESWQASLLQLSQSAAAAAAAAGPPGAAVGSSALVTHADDAVAAAACNTDGADIDMQDAAPVQPAAPEQQQQQGQLVLSPYAAQLLQQACEVAMQHPEQLMLQGTLSAADSPPSSANTTTADPTNGAAAPGNSQSAAGTAGAGVQQTEAGFSAEAQLRAGALPPSRPPQQQERPRAAVERAAYTSTATADAATAAGGAAPGGYRMSFIQAPGTGTRRHQRQQQQPRDDSEPGDACTHGVVLLAGLVEVLLQRLLRAAAEVAASDPQLLLNSSPADPAGSGAHAVGTAAAGAAAAGAAGKAAASVGGAAAGGAGTAAAGAGAAAGGAGGGAVSSVPHGLPDGAVLMSSSPGQQPQVLVGAKHVQLAVVQDEDLATLLQHSWPGEPLASAVGWAGAVPRSIDPQLLPDPQSEPLTAYLLQVADGSWQQEQQGAAGGRPRCRVVQPADLRVYCGVRLSAPPAAIPCSPATATPAAEGAAAAAGSSCAAVGPSVTCSFLSGWQCSTCAAETAALSEAGFEAQMDACKQGLQQMQGLLMLSQQPEQQGQGLGPSSSSSNNIAGQVLLEAQLQQLLQATRLYHLQQPCWYDSASSASGDGSSSRGAGHSAAVPQQGQQQQQQQRLSRDAAQLEKVQTELQSLRDVVALREICLQQQESHSVFPQEYFEQLVQDVLCDVVSKRRQEQEQFLQQAQDQLKRLLRPSSAAAATAAFGLPGSTGLGMAPGTVTAGSSSAAVQGQDQGEAAELEGEVLHDLQLQPDALHLLQQAAEDFLVQQLSGANRLALHAGRQEVGPQDLRLALLSSSYGHLVPGGGGLRALAGSAGGLGSGTSSRSKRRKGA